MSVLRRGVTIVSSLTASKYFRPCRGMGLKLLSRVLLKMDVSRATGGDREVNKMVDIMPTRAITGHQ